MSASLGLIFTIEIDGKPTIAFEARQLREAAELCAERWFRDDLNALRSNGEPLCRIASKLRARISNERERVVYREAAQATNAEDGLLLAYLVALDGPG
jgi:hypothetical protein